MRRPSALHGVPAVKGCAPWLRTALAACGRRRPLATALRLRMKRHTVTCWGLCDAHRKLFDEGFVALIECDPQRSGVPADQNHLRPEQAWRTGRLAQLQREALGPDGRRRAGVSSRRRGRRSITP